jgi:hypothetical protein
VAAQLLIPAYFFLLLLLSFFIRSRTVIHNFKGFMLFAHYIKFDLYFFTDLFFSISFLCIRFLLDFISKLIFILFIAQHFSLYVKFGSHFFNYFFSLDPFFNLVFFFQFLLLTPGLLRVEFHDFFLNTMILVSKSHLRV